MIIDISHHNGDINWRLASRQVKCVFIKCTEGQSYIDPMFLRNSNRAKQHGLQVGYYHYATLNSENVVDDAIAEANRFISFVEKAPKPDLPLVLDIEENKGHIHKIKVAYFIELFIDHLAFHGYEDSMIYSYTPFLNSNLPHDHNLGKYPLWLADYTGEYNIPRGWNGVTLHQYTDKGRVKGIYSNVDLNKYVT